MIIKNLKSKKLLLNKLEYENLYSADVNKQKEIDSMFIDIFKIKSELEVERSQLAPSTGDTVLVSGENLLCGIDHHLSGK